MDGPPSRRGLVAALCLALAACVVAGVLAAASWPDPDAGDDFGRTPAVTVPAERTGGPPAGRTAEGGTAPGGTAARDGSTDSEPTRVALPRLDVSAPVDPVGVDAEGQVEIPDDPRRVGWYRFSPAPGASGGSTVVVGHVDSDGRGLGVLIALNDVREGDTAVVRRADGRSVTYEVTARRTVAKDALAASGAFRRDGPAVLTLITCAGPYLADRGGYQNNLVVTAVERPR
ncbi:class F sortase [Streptomyces sp. NPDC000983]|uniref:class F sortase n=1 Tax=Streptomyces sp. NPDC000983 TaxID=3154373 RepID=UPI0033347739